MCYANGKDAADWDLVARLRGGRPDVPADRPDDFIEGRDAILAAFRARPARTTRHVTSNVVIGVESATSARGECALVLYTAHKAPIRRLLPRPRRADLGRLAIRGAARLADLCSRDRRACVKAGPGLHMVPARVIGHNVT